MFYEFEIRCIHNSKNNCFENNHAVGREKGGEFYENTRRFDEFSYNQNKSFKCVIDFIITEVPYSKTKLR